MLIDSMRSIHFDAQGFNRTYWDFFSALGLFFSVFLLFAAVLAWQLGGLPSEILARVRSPAWALAIRHSFELEIRLYHPHRFLDHHHDMFDCCGMACREEGKLRLALRSLQKRSLTCCCYFSKSTGGCRSHVLALL